MVKSRIRAFITPEENSAYEAGFQYGYYGYGGEKQHRICTNPATTRAWDLGKYDGESEMVNLERSGDR